MKEEFFSKLNIKNYNNELEKILEKKDFSMDTKNLLLSMFYKIEVAYNDYATVKRIVANKNEFLENILNNIKDCNKIEIVKPRTDEFANFAKENIRFKIDFNKKIIQSLENEKSMLFALCELNNFRIYLKEEYNLVRNSLPYLLNEGKDINNIEIIRDFNAWSWNTVPSEISSIECNLIYQNIQLLINNKLLSNIMAESKDLDFVKILEEELLSMFKKEYVDKLMQLLFKIAVIVCTLKNKEETKRLIEERSIIENELNKISDKKEYIKELSKQKKKLTDNIKNIDTIINDKDLLASEYEKRNSNLPEYNKIFSISHLIEILTKERKKYIKQLNICNENLDPIKFVEKKSKLEDDLELLKNVNNSEKEYYYIDEFELLFIEGFNEKIKKSTYKKEIVDLLCELRYYNFVPYKKNEYIKDAEKLRKSMNKVKENLIEKMYELKIINNLTTNKRLNMDLIKNIFDLKVISLEEVYFELKVTKDKYVLNIYDEGDSLEKTVEYEKKNYKGVKFKLNKKIKLIL